MQEKIQSEKICYIITKSNFGGAQKYVFEIAEGMKRSGKEVFVIVGGEGLLIKKLEQAGIKTFIIKSMQRDISWLKECQSFWEIFKILKKEKPDIVHLNSSKAGTLGSIASRMNRIKKIIFTIHGWAFNETRPWWQKILIKFSYLFTILMCHKSIAVSSETKKQGVVIPFYSKIENKIVIIPNAIQDIVFLSKTNARHELEKILKTHFKKDIFLIGVLAELHPIKGLGFLIETIEKMIFHYPKIKLIIVGDGELRHKIKMVIKNKELEDVIFMTGHLPDGSVYLKAFDLFVLPSISEASPLSILEAGLAGVPIIASRVGGIPEMILDEQSGLLFEPKNTLDLSHKIEILHNHPDLGQIFAKEMQERVTKNYSFDVLIKTTQEIYFDL